jgi:cyclopropane fatty-acyl-phospholipid synthase-like methyltransferase
MSPCFRGSVACSHASMAFLCALSVIAALPAQTRTPDVHFTPTRHAIADAMLSLARVTAEDMVYDLGSGDGRIPIIAAQKYGARGVGIEIDPRLIAIARQHAREGGVEDKVTFVEGDLFTADITRATVVTLYLSASMNARLEAKLKRELRPGARIVSHQFAIGHWTPDERTRVDFSELFFWKIKP